MLYGAPERIRTSEPQIRNTFLYLIASLIELSVGKKEPPVIDGSVFYSIGR